MIRKRSEKGEEQEAVNPQVQAESRVPGEPMGNYSEGGAQSSSCDMDTQDPDVHLRVETAKGSSKIRGLDSYERCAKLKMEENKRHREERAQTQGGGEREEKRVRVERNEGESRGVVTSDMDIDRVAATEWEGVKEEY